MISKIFFVILSVWVIDIHISEHKYPLNMYKVSWGYVELPV